ncbi:MAG: hypothetical protein CVV58_01490 [Tenericutes bacterium HGW-Tenericutes-3]|nr:MAG: hypothetical protein CVV58_01490 [Tenericutes bacterium HGW-Tenericutes-3]
MSIKTLTHPEFFQGKHKKNNYFEGWYYKFVSQDEKDTLAFIPGVSINSEDRHAFIQVFISHHNGKNVQLKTHYFRFKYEDFIFNEKVFWIKIGQNTFSNNHIEINLDEKDFKISGILKMSHLSPIRRSLLSPNIMGIFGYLGFMECYHGIVSMSHKLEGSLGVNENNILFQDGKGYIEKDWGKSFPDAYVWLQSNHFKDPLTSFMFSYANIPFLGFHFKGLIANLVINNKEYRFATYNRAKILDEKLNGSSASYLIKKGKYLLQIDAHSTSQIDLVSPRNGQMIEQIKEGLSGQIQLTLKYKNKIIYQDTGYHAGIEIMKK